MVFHEILWDSLTSPTFPLLLSTFPHIYLLFPTHTLFFPIISCVFPHVSLILFSQNSVLFAGNNVETTQLYICVRHCHSICGYVFTLNGGAVSWSSKTQSVVALSSTEAEYIGITHAAKEAIWVRHLLSELYSPKVLEYPLTVHCDNRSAIELVKNATFHSRTKHIAIRYHYIREAFNEGIIVLTHRGTDDMPADMFTKALIHVKLTKFAQSVGVFST